MFYGDLREVQTNIALSDDFITPLDTMLRLSGMKRILYKKRDYLFRFGIWNNRLEIPLRFELPKPRTLVIGHSDLDLNEQDETAIHNLGVKDIWAVNLSFPSTKSRTYPLGLTNQSLESFAHEVMGNREILRRLMLNPPAENRKYFIYANFNTKTNPKIREQVLNLCLQNPDIKVKSPQLTHCAREEYLRDISESLIVVCPRGNGRDTHRFWEALYLGAIPVVHSQEIPQRFLIDLNLPMIVVDDWEEIMDHNFMTSVLNDLYSKKFDFSLLSLNYWINELLTRIARTNNFKSFGSL